MTALGGTANDLWACGPERVQHWDGHSWATVRSHSSSCRGLAVLGKYVYMGNPEPTRVYRHPSF